MTTRTWIGGGNNKASNPKDWNPTGVPQPGDILTMARGTMNITGNDSALAVRSVGFTFLSGDVLHTTGSTHIDLSLSAQAFIIDSGATQIGISGTDTLYLALNGAGQPADATVDLKANATWIGGFRNWSVGGGVDATSITINGGPHSTFINGPSAVSTLDSNVENGRAKINVPVGGTGSWEVVGVTNLGSGPSGSKLEFGGSVSAGQTIGVYSIVPASEGPGEPILQIDKPNLFSGSVILYTAAGTPTAEIDLMGLAKADSYTYQNDMLNIFSGSAVIDKLRLHDSTQYGFEVEKKSGSVNIVAFTDSTHTTVGTPLLIHV